MSVNPVTLKVPPVLLLNESVFVLLLGIKIVAPNSKSIGSIAKYVLLAIWIIVIGILISIGVKQASEYAYDGRVYEKQTININPTDTLYIKFKNNDYYSKDINDYKEFNVTKDSLNQDVVYSNTISFQIEKTDELFPYIKINKEAKGYSFENANTRAGKIKYGYKIIGNQLVLDNYLITELKDQYRDQKVEIKLYLPKYVCGYLNSNLNKGDFYIGINDFGFVKGIPYQGKLSLEFIKQYINKTITNYIKGSKIDNSMIEVELINVNKPDIPIYNQNPKYTEYLEKKKEYLEKYSDFLQKYKEWEQKYDIFNHKLIEIYNNKETRAMLIEYVKKHDPENCVLELLYSDYQMKYNEDDYVKELKLDKNHSYYLYHQLYNHT